MARHARINVGADFELDVVISTTHERDDDGCGSPSHTGNSMTGCRGSRAITTARFDGTAEEALAVLNGLLADMEFDE